MLISSNHYQCRMRRLFSQLSTLYEESQEDNEDKISEYDIIESIEGIYVLSFCSTKKKNNTKFNICFLLA